MPRAAPESYCATSGPGASYGAYALCPAGAGVPASFGASTGAGPDSDTGVSTATYTGAVAAATSADSLSS